MQPQYNLVCHYRESNQDDKLGVYYASLNGQILLRVTRVMLKFVLQTVMQVMKSSKQDETKMILHPKLGLGLAILHEVWCYISKS